MTNLSKLLDDRMRCHAIDVAGITIMLPSRPWRWATFEGSQDTLRYLEPERGANAWGIMKQKMVRIKVRSVFVWLRW
jgi:hypothetical protein